eukprot:gene5401-7138_t
MSYEQHIPSGPHTHREPYQRLLTIHVQLLHSRPTSQNTVFVTPEGAAIHNVMLAGIVVEVENSGPLVSYRVDDGTGNIPCIVWRNPSISTNASLKIFPFEKDIPDDHVFLRVPLATHVLVWGHLSVFRGQQQVIVHGLSCITPSQELEHWLEAIAVFNSVSIQI